MGADSKKLLKIDGNMLKGYRDQFEGALHGGNWEI